VRIFLGTVYTSRNKITGATFSLIWWDCTEKNVSADVGWEAGEIEAVHSCLSAVEQFDIGEHPLPTDKSESFGFVLRFRSSWLGEIDGVIFFPMFFIESRDSPGVCERDTPNGSSVC
jgi:hypothetical protein